MSQDSIRGTQDAKNTYTRGGYRGGKPREQVRPPQKTPSATMRPAKKRSDDESARR